LYVEDRFFSGRVYGQLHSKLVCFVSLGDFGIIYGAVTCLALAEAERSMTFWSARKKYRSNI